MAPVRLLVVGAGSRGQTYAGYAAAAPGEVQIVGVAEPREHARQRLAVEHGIPAERVFSDWREAIAQPRFADGVIVATQDRMHLEPALAFAQAGYHILLEKPMAPNPEDCQRIVEESRRSGVIFAVCHVLRYTRYSALLKRLVAEGAIGEVVSVDHLEPVGFWHQAHSFVRGNWRREDASSPMLLSKSCHDLDWLRYVIGRRCLQVSSFGSLTHFTPAARPSGAADRCLDCPVEPDCAYSARKIYLERVAVGQTGWPVDVLTNDLTVAGVTEALRTGPYGRCVYTCDNDVVDHQVVSLRYEGDITATFTMTGFTRGRDRETRIFGTRGELRGDGREVEVFDFLTEQTTTHRADAASDGSILTGHGGGDFGLMAAFVGALRTGDRSHILSGPEESLETHLTVFAAETARREGRVVDVGSDDQWAASPGRLQSG